MRPSSWSCSGTLGMQMCSYFCSWLRHAAMHPQRLEPWKPPSRRKDSPCREPCVVLVMPANSFLHAGLQLGLFGDSGTRTCGGAAASYGHEELDAQTFASWGISYLKYDNCNAVKKDK